MGENSVSGGHQEYVVQADAIENLTITTAPAGREPLPRHLQDPSRWPLAAEWEALAAGAHRARPGEDGSKVPPYVPRDVDAELRARITDGGLVLLVGDSTAGKTRTAFEAVRAELPDARILAPPAGSDFGRLPEAVERAGTRCVVWLDDLERYLGPGGLEPDLLDELQRVGAPVVATMRQGPYETFGAHGPFGGERGAEGGTRLLRRADVVDLERLWSEGELARAEESSDTRIVDALTHHGPHGVAEYLAAGPALLREWRRARSATGHPRGAALVAAAVDLKRAGLFGPYDRSVLAELHERHLEGAGGTVLRPESLDEAFDWASRIRFGVTSLLLPAGGGTWHVFDYLVDHTDSAVPDWVWQTALAHAADDGDRFWVGVNAADEAPDIAERALGPLAARGDPHATTSLGYLLANTGRLDEAEALFLDAVGKGTPYAAVGLAFLLNETGRADEAERLLRDALDAGDRDAGIVLGALLTRGGRPVDAEHLLRDAFDSGHPDAAPYLGAALTAQGRTEEAEAVLRGALDEGHPHTPLKLGVLLAQTGRAEEAEQMFRRALALEPDSGEASYALGGHYLMTDDPARAEPFLRTAADDGTPGAAAVLGFLLVLLDRPDEAAPVLARALGEAPAAGVAPLMLALAMAGRTPEAEDLFRELPENHPEYDLASVAANALFRQRPGPPPATTG
ncbi:tetratricopeptide repeat protein [Streptomyces sp. NPDC002004]